IEVFGPEYGERHRGLDEQVVESGETLRGIEEVFFDLNGQKRTFLTTKAPLRDTRGVSAAVVTVSFDVTALKARETEVAEKSGLLEATKDAMVQGLIVLDRDMTIVASNAQAAKLLGLPDAMLAPETAYESVLRRLAESGVLGLGEPEVLSAETVERLHRSPDEAWEHVLPNGMALEFSCREMAGGGRVITLTDVTAHKRTEAAIRHAKDEAERANRAKSDFLSHMSHELRTPLNAILGFSEIMRDELFGPLGNDRYRGFAHDVLGSGQELLRLIDDMLDLARIEAGTMRLDESEIDVASVILDVIRRLGEEADQSGVRMEMRARPGSPRLFADRRKFGQIVEHILANAVKFSHRNSAVAIDVGLSDDGAIEIAVADNGPGMDAETLSASMEAFGRPGDAMTRPQRGKGLGLPLARELMALHGGRLEISSVLGEGTVVRIRFPAGRTIRQAVNALR
ncbi:MAG: PAS domain-containing protein, partial [Rhodospirillaceae bacterium]|nr:PAS domain-containing protein [Rhodospirillaceae bacterium]